MIYVVTLMTQFKNKVSEINRNINNGILWIPDEKWTAGYFLNLDDAVDAVMNNYYGDGFTYAVIEEHGEGFYQIPKSTKWFRQDWDGYKYFREEIAPPIRNCVRGYAFD